MPKPTRLRHTLTTFSSESLNMLAVLMTGAAVAAQTPAKPIMLKPEVAAQLKTFTDNYVTRGVTRFSCGYGRWGIRMATQQQYHPAVNLACNVLRQLPREESQKLLSTIGESITDNTISAEEQTTIRRILQTNNVQIDCTSLDEALTAIPDTKPTVVAGKRIARVAADCDTPLNALTTYFKQDTPAAPPTTPESSPQER